MAENVVIRLSSRQWGEEPARPTLVAVHGVSGTAWDFHQVGPRLAGRWQVVAPDLPGFGLSAWDPWARYSVDAMVTALADFIRGLQVGPITYLGHSIAGRMGILVADRHPDLIRHLILVDAGPGTGPGSSKVRQRVAAWPESGSREEILTQYRSLYGSDSDEIYAERMAAYLEDLGEGRVRIRRDPAVKAHIFAPPAAQGGPDFWGAWGRLTQPVLVVHGGRSQMLTTEILERMQAEHGATEVVTIADAGHNIPADAPERLAEIVLHQD